MDGNNPARFTMAGAGDASSPATAEPRCSTSEPSLAGFSSASRQQERTNVLRVPFGVRLPRRRRPKRADSWATLVIPFQVGGGGPQPTPPWAA